MRFQGPVWLAVLAAASAVFAVNMQIAETASNKKPTAKASSFLKFKLIFLSIPLELIIPYISLNFKPGTVNFKNNSYFIQYYGYICIKVSDTDYTRKFPCFARLMHRKMENKLSTQKQSFLC
ncbi:MAG TPA: hypothetical protein DCZ94_14345 [Lentisphaeria bacterium]|nr:MAG: hypothetical protein A2X48_01690 [Lentisphaerae bacterium GWF2_49_21]HBC88127.1 hypothetical protein [Lentisphaeria bacterium]